MATTVWTDVTQTRDVNYMSVAAEVEDAARQSVMTSLIIQRARVSTQHLKFILLL